MRNLPARNKREALEQLRADENLVEAGGIDLPGGTIRFFSAANDEDFQGNKENKLRFRREQRRQKQRLRHAG